MRALATATVPALVALLGASAGSALTLTSPDLAPGGRIAMEQAFDGADCPGRNVSPALVWSDAPEGTQSFAVTCYDPDAPTGSGFWHWVVFDIPADVTELPTGAGSGDMAGLPEGAKHARNDTGAPGYLGAAPPPGHGEHRYVFTVYALGVPTLDLDESATPAYVGFNLTFNTLARGTIVAVYDR